jgi:hypothetical protein
MASLVTSPSQCSRVKWVYLVTLDDTQRSGTGPSTIIPVVENHSADTAVQITCESGIHDLHTKFETNTFTGCAMVDGDLSEAVLVRSSSCHLVT